MMRRRALWSLIILKIRPFFRAPPQRECLVEDGAAGALIMRDPDGIMTGIKVGSKCARQNETLQIWRSPWAYRTVVC